MNKPKKEKPKNKKVLVTVIVITLLLVVSSIALVVSNSIKSENRKQAAIKAEKARLAADPITPTGLFIAANKARAAAGAQAMASQDFLTKAAQQQCDDMVTYKYVAYKNPTTGKESNSYITDNKGDVYITTYISDLATALPVTQTATDFITQRAKEAPAITDTKYNIVGWAVCRPPETINQLYVVAMEATKAEKPANTATNNYYSAPAASTSKRCYTTYNPGVTNYGGSGYLINPSSSTTCY